ncbi:hypothetical protein [Pseudobacteriovorax antillogorgiicola]|uniref:Uncharacterized protein n=1 Tax=Pseudobacteriovorax antillogorgiicola TaxID=1513793 RepID=A0A1Y6CCV6_9BACT|nr:hypothetical protein [Pseudobacteriovorax antillogorgiicola]TCS49333.1 hypothetical protein EDD56_11512 [Pseudobacteriovorax antillogorgiicola]SMF47974.1 hypothetical protein SAMN06296036_114172 [Pseudobacteriovorax antillogorgiicola]
MDPLLVRHLKRINAIRFSRESISFLIRAVRSVLFSLILMTVWASLDPRNQDAQLLVGFISLVTFLGLSLRWQNQRIGADETLKSLEINYPKVDVSAFSLRTEQRCNVAWTQNLKRSQNDFFRENARILAFKASTLILPTMLWILVSQISPGAVSTAIYSMKKVVAQLNQGTKLYVIEGQAKEADPNEYILSTSQVAEFDLLEQNRVEIRVVTSQGEKPYVVVQPKNSDLKQTFRLTPIKSEDAREAQWVHSITFNVQDDSELFVSSVSGTTPAARINVKRLPVPRVALKPTRPLQDPWPDEKPLSLEIDVEAENPLQLVRLLIRSEGQTHEELVSNVLADDKKDLNTKYSLLLESYVQRDMATIEIVAEAIDRHLPNPLIGRSQPLIVRTASAYGRYRETLNTLRQVKEVMDQARSTDAKELDQQAAELMAKANNQAEESPFFDGLDRHTLRMLQSEVDNLAQELDSDRLLQTSEELNRFLFEHETLDDRERDRDFFVAARSLSRLVEKPKAERPLDVGTVTDRLKSFLKEREQRWQVRTKYLDNQAIPPQWQEVSQGSFQKAMDRVAQQAQNDKGTQKALQELSQTVADYRQWIEGLEKAEDASRQKDERKRQKGLADGRKILRELQKRQSKISSGLDRAATKNEGELSDQWGSLRMDQNANIKQTGSLEAQLRSLSPQASDRIKAALEAMKLTVQAGNEDAFIQAETSSDMAGRLLRQADNAARKSQRQQQRRGRRRRVTSDQYYGSSVAGGDVEIRREYEVNRRYREDVLEEVRRARNVEGRDKQLLENYLRKVIR